MPVPQRILVVRDGAVDAELVRMRRSLGRDPLVLAAPTAEAQRVVRELGVEPQVEVPLAPVKFPPADRGHRLDALVRSYALHDRFRDVVVVTDTVTSTLLLRALAPDQLATGGAVTVVGLPRGERQSDGRRAVGGGAILGAVAGVVGPPGLFLALAAAIAVLGLVLLLVERVRHLGRELLLGAAVAVAVLLVVLASANRFPGFW